jgi:agmatinase
MHLYTEKPLKFAFSKTSFKEYSPQSVDEAKFGILGVPFDSTTTYQAGARFGPLYVREASYNFEKFHLILNKKFGICLYDCGNLEVVPGNFHRTCNQLQTVISSMIEKEITPIVIGGEHTISYGITKAINIRDATIIHFDAHMDLRDSYIGEKYSHATIMHRIHDQKPKNIIQIGTRSCSQGELDFARKNGIEHYTPQEIRKDIVGIEKIISRIKGPIYVTVDLDVLDPAYAPSVGTPAPGGLDSLELETLMFSLRNKHIIGFDVMEVSSTTVGDVTSLNAAKVILDLLFLQ